MKLIILTALAGVAVMFSGCVDAAKHAQSLHSSQERQMTLGTVQREIRRGMSQADVAEALGAPNIVSRDSAGRETWIFDKIATEASYSNSSGSAVGFGGAGGGASTLILGGLLGSYSANAGASASTQRTLTVVIKFDSAGLVDTFSYHSSKF